MKSSVIREYYRLAKPGIIYGNVITTVATFLFAWRWHFSTSHILEQFVMLFLATTLGIAFVIGSACVFNNYLDRTIDAKMPRTKNRALVTGKISVRYALLYGTVLGIIGTTILFFFVNLVTTLLAIVGFISYVLIYGIAKRESHWGAVIGSVPGAVPIVVGYTAVTNHLDVAALLLFLILVMWQMPHFYAIAMYRMDDYVSAGIPVFPAKKGMRTTKVHILWYVIGFIICSSLVTAFGYAGFIYLGVMLLTGGVWLWYVVKGFKVTEKDLEAKWARKIFLLSLMVLMVFCVTLSISPFLI